MYNPAKSIKPISEAAAQNCMDISSGHVKHIDMNCVLRWHGMFCFKGDTYRYNPNFRIFFQQFLRVLSKVNIRFE